MINLPNPRLPGPDGRGGDGALGGRSEKGVRVYLIDGRTEAFPFATNAVNRGPVFTVERFFPEHRKAVDVRSFLTVDVSHALVFEAFGSRYVAGSVQKAP